MFVKIFVISLLTLLSVATNTYTPSDDQLLLKGLLPLLHVVGDFFLDGPYSVSAAPIGPKAYKIPTKEQVKYYAYVAAAPYFGYDLDDLTCEPCLRFKRDVYGHTVRKNTVHDTVSLVYVSKKRKEIVVSFRGTQNVWNVVLDLLIFNVNVNGAPSNIRVHQGVYIAMMSLYEQVVNLVGGLRNEFPNYKLVFTGHSLGGSMARILVFFLLHLKQFPGAVYELYTYGEIRVGNQAFADYMNGQNITTARAVSRADMFCHFPPTSVATLITTGDYFVHCAPEFWINGQDDQRFCDDSVYEDPKCSNSLAPLYCIFDHFSYFDINLINFMGQPVRILELPLGLPQPCDILPPLPKPIDKFIGSVTDLALPVSGYVPLIGR